MLILVLFYRVCKHVIIVILSKILCSYVCVVVEVIYTCKTGHFDKDPLCLCLCFL